MLFVRVDVARAPRWVERVSRTCAGAPGDRPTRDSTPRTPIYWDAGRSLREGG